MAFDQSTRNRLQKFVSNARAILSEEFTRQLQATYGLDPKQGTIAAIDSLTHLDNRQRQTTHLLRETLAHYLATTPGKSEKDRTKQVLDRIVREQAFTVLNRLAALRMAEARGFLLESIAKAHSSKGFQLYRQLSGTAHGETGDAYRNYLFSLFDEFSLDLAVLFDRHSAQGRLFPRESALLELLAEINHHEIEHLWAEDETIGWIYQYFNSQEERKKMRAESQAPRNSRELAVRNQFFTPRYVVEFLTDNTLGRIWYEMTQGNTALVDSCRYLVRRPTEIFLEPGETAPEAESSNTEALSQEELLKQPVYIPHRPLKDPRSIRMLDPACGSMHFGLYAFDLFERIYLEAWQLEQQQGPDTFTREAGQQALQSTFDSVETFKQQIPKLIIEHNIHGVDIDPRAVQIAGLSLWQRAQRAWHQQGIKPHQRPTIVKSNIVCAEPMPGEKALLQEFTSKLNPPVLGQLLEVIFDKMQLAGEAGTLLKIEEEIQTAINEAREQWLKQSGSNSVGDMFQAELDAATPQAKLGFDLSGVDDETFWDDAEQRILQALSVYADQAESNADQKRLFAEDAAKGFAFIDLCRKRFDVVLMNPPFGQPTGKVYEYCHSAFNTAHSDIYASFIARCIILSPRGLTGAISSSSFMLSPRMEEFRKNIFVPNLKILADLGLGVMDDAMVRSAIYVVGSSIGAEFYGSDAREIMEQVKQSASAAEIVDRLNVHLKETFINLPQAKLIINAPPSVHSLLAKGPFLEPSFGTAREGMKTFDNDRFIRLAWEVCPQDIGPNRHWRRFYKGGEFSYFYSEPQLLLNWSCDGAELMEKNISINGSTAQVRQASSYWGLRGATYSKRSSVFSARVLPDGCIFTSNGPAVIPLNNTDESYLLGWINSAPIRALIHLNSGAYDSYSTGALKRLPWVEPDDKTIKAVGDSTKAACLRYINVESQLTETSAWFSHLPTAKSINELKEVINLLQQERGKKLSRALDIIDEEVCRLYGLSDKEWILDILGNGLRYGIDFDGGFDHEEIYHLCISYLVGLAFQRWSKDYQNFSEVTDPFSAPPSSPPGLNLESEGVSVLDTESLVALVWKLSESYFDGYFFGASGVDNASLYGYFESPNNFFRRHVERYSGSKRAAPLYWPLQTPSGSYTLWVYYHRLNEQTLYTCVNDYIDGPSGKLTQVEQDLNGLRSKSARSSKEEKELEKLSDLASELRDFREELLRLAKFWKPNLNDGVQITAAPLWKLFQHKAWQKKLKETWEKLEKGDYDWAHLACSIWPERVLRKCHQDRSLAIAHYVEDHFWHEVEVPVKRGKKLTGETKFDWQPKDLSESELNALVKKLAAEVK